MIGRFALGFLCAAGMAGESSAQSGAAALVPQPVSMVAREGWFRFSADTRIIGRGPAAAEARELMEALAPAMGFQLELSEVEPASSTLVLAALDEARLDACTTSFRPSSSKLCRPCWQKESSIPVNDIP
ncbi:MAG TPA: hypothetical protein PLF81_02360 [Candidatus Anammoximicrobium sp.]|nr:hypothetical protein [Candidatus Anammoximicrobium sp.]